MTALEQDSPKVQNSPQPAKSWWLELEIWLLMAFVAAVFFLQSTRLNLQADEARRGYAAAEILRTGNWLAFDGDTNDVSRQPLGNWLIAFCGKLRGDVDNIAIRLPAMIALVLTSLVLYAATRQFFTKAGALTAAGAYPTMMQVLESGRGGEDEIVATFLISSSLLAWYVGRSKNWNSLAVWITSYSLAALAVLTKGPTAAACFVVPVVGYLVLTRRWRELANRSHVAGILVFAVLIGGWQVGPHISVRDFGQTASLLSSSGLKELAFAPLAAVLYTLPWSLLLLHFFSPRFRAALRAGSSPVLFFVLCTLATFVLGCVDAHHLGQSLLPTFVFVSIFCGMVVDQCESAGEAAWSSRGLRVFLSCSAILAAMLGALVAVSPLINRPWAYDVNPSPWQGLAFAAAAAVIAGVLVGGAVGRVRQSAGRCAMCLIAFLGMTYSMVVVNSRARNEPDVAGRVTRFVPHSSSGSQLVSLGPVDRAFAYYVGRPVDRVELPVSKSAADLVVELFCFQRTQLADADVPFPWKKVAEVVVANGAGPNPDQAVVIGQRISADESAARTARNASKRTRVTGK